MSISERPTLVIPQPDAVIAVRRVQEYVQNRFAEAITLADLCVVSGLKVRRLQMAFRTVVDMTPMQYVRSERLRRARALLGQAGCLSVTWAATQSGFWHMAQFTQDYRRMFGELPSETLRQSAARKVCERRAA